MYLFRVGSTLDPDWILVSAVVRVVQQLVRFVATIEAAMFPVAGPVEPFGLC